MADLASTVIYGYLQVNDSITANNLITAPKLTLTQATGTAPLTITSTTLVSNLNVDYLDGQHGSYYLDAGNLTGTLSAGRIASNSITLAKLETIPTATILGRNTTAEGNIEELSTATVKTMLNLTGTNSGDQNLFSHIHALNSSGTDVTNSPFNVTSSAEAITLKAGTNVTLAMDTSGVVTINSAYTNTATAADGIFDGTNTGTEIKYSPYSTQQTGILSFDTSATAPTRTDRLNLNGYFYATQLYEGSTRALVRKTSDTTVTTHKFALFDISSGDIIRSPLTFNDSGTSNSELISASQVNTRIDNAVAGIGARLLPPVADLTALKAVNTTALTDKTMINCETLGLYRLDLDSSATADDNRIVAPNTGSGRWLKMSASINDHNNLTAIQGGGTGDYQHLTTTQLGYIHASGSDNQNIFSTIAVSGQSNIVADTTSDTLTFVAGNNITLTTDANADSLTINSANPSNYGVCSTASATAAKTVTITNFALVTGVKVTVKFLNANTATNPTLNVNSTGAKALYDGTTNINATLIEAGKIYDFVYDGTNYVLISGSGSGSGSVTTPISKTITATANQTEFTYTTGDGWTDDLLGLLVFRSGIYMTPVTDYTIDNINKKITFVTPCEVNEIITVIFNNSGAVDIAYTPPDININSSSKSFTSIVGQVDFDVSDIYPTDYFNFAVFRNGLLQLQGLDYVLDTSAPGSEKVTLTEACVINEIIIVQFNTTNTNVIIPDASETVKGVVELATPAEVLAGVDDERVVTAKDLDYSHATIDSDRIYEGVDLTTKFAAEIAGYSDVWAWIKARITAADYSGLHVGDYIPFTMNGNAIKAQIAGIDTYYRTGDIEIGHHIDFISKDCYPTPMLWNTTNINNGNATNAAPWMVSNLKNVINTTWYNSLPAPLKAQIIEKKAHIETRYASGSTLTDSTGVAWNDIGKLWVPSEGEVYGAVHYGTKGFSSTQNAEYPIFAASWRNRIKGIGDGGERCRWWLLSVYGGNSTQACSVGAVGVAECASTSWTPMYAPVCFRIG